MYECPNRASKQEHETDDDYGVWWEWHHRSCTCLIMDLYHFQMVEQCDHVRAYWEDAGLQKVRWDITYGMLLEYPKGLAYMIKIKYPYR